jgi:seryl-tRNA synthetase
MANVKVKREVEGKVTEVEIDEADVLETDELVTEAAPDKLQADKKFSQKDVNALLAKERKTAQAKLEVLQTKHDELLKSIADKEAEAEDAAKTKVEGLRKGVPETIGKLLDKLTYSEQLEWLQDPANQIQKKTVPPLPPERQNVPQVPRIERIV